MNHNGRKVFWGIYFIVAAVLLILFKVGTISIGSWGWGNFLGIDIWQILLGFLLLGFTIKGIFDRNVGEILFSIAFQLIVFDNELHIEFLTPWYVLGAAILGTIGLSMIIKPKSKWSQNNAFDWNNQNNQCGGNTCGNNNRGGNNQTGNFSNTEEHVNGERVWFKTSMGAGVKYVQSDNFLSANLNTSFGNMKVYFENAIIQPGTIAEIFVENSFGCVQIYVPKSWYVENQMRASFGAVEEKNHAMSNGVPKVILTGTTSFGAVEVYYI